MQTNPSTPCPDVRVSLENSHLEVMSLIELPAHTTVARAHELLSALIQLATARGWLCRVTGPLGTDRIVQRAYALARAAGCPVASVLTETIREVA